MKINSNYSNPNNISFGALSINPNVKKAGLYALNELEKAVPQLKEEAKDVDIYIKYFKKYDRILNKWVGNFAIKVTTLSEKPENIIGKLKSFFKPKFYSIEKCRIKYIETKDIIETAEKTKKEFIDAYFKTVDGKFEQIQKLINQ